MAFKTPVKEKEQKSLFWDFPGAKYKGHLPTAAVVIRSRPKPTWSACAGVLSSKKISRSVLDRGRYLRFCSSLIPAFLQNRKERMNEWTFFSYLSTECFLFHAWKNIPFTIFCQACWMVVVEAAVAHNLWLLLVLPRNGSRTSSETFQIPETFSNRERKWYFFLSLVVFVSQNQIRRFWII